MELTGIITVIRDAVLKRPSLANWKVLKVSITLQAPNGNKVKISRDYGESGIKTVVPMSKDIIV